MDLYQRENTVVIVSAYNEEQAEIEKTLNSIRSNEASYVLIDDCSIRKVDGADIRNCPNAGKKNSQFIALEKISQDTKYIVSVDSDTEIDNEAIARAIAQFGINTGAVVGNISIKNKCIFPYIIDCLYWNSFNLGRAIGSLFGQVPVCSGAFTVYRADLFRKYITESLKRPIQGGEDRYITYLLLRDGYNTKYAYTAIAKTSTPTGLKFVKQQLRWTKSFWRGLFYSWRAYKNNWYLCANNVFTAVSRLINVIGFAVLVLAVLTGEFRVVGIILLASLVHGIIRSLYGVIIRRELKFLLFSIWGLFSILLIAPMNIYAILTIKKDRWGNR
jgi:cellulose synthase/poly-beta-1,6-N-acetylglucosamine synthase-like glycosyltransferase